MKSKKKLNWWNTEKCKTQYTSVMFVTPTPGMVLVKALQKREEELNKYRNERVKMVEKGGLKIKSEFNHPPLARVVVDKIKKKKV